MHLFTYVFCIHQMSKSNKWRNVKQNDSICQDFHCASHSQGLASYTETKLLELLRSVPVKLLPACLWGGIRIWTTCWRSVHPSCPLLGPAHPLAHPSLISFPVVFINPPCWPNSAGTNSLLGQCGGWMWPLQASTCSCASPASFWSGANLILTFATALGWPKSLGPA